MKKFLCLAVLLSTSVVTFGQISKAQMALDDNKIQEAQEAIQKALTPESIQELLSKGKNKRLPKLIIWQAILKAAS